MTLIKRLVTLWKISTPTVPDEQKQDALVWKFSRLIGKGHEIEAEWQKIQQDEHNAFFAYQIMRGQAEREWAYKKGIADGIKWCVKHFS